MFALLKFLPKNHLSWLFGKLAEVSLPSFLLLALIKLYSRLYKLNLAEVRDSLASFSCFADFFVRELSPGIRPVGPGLVSPADGTLVAGGKIKEGELLQAKGSYYSLDKFLGDEELAREFDSGSFQTIYLSPRDYHHVHSPLAAEVLETIHIPGTLWPVNQWSVKNISQLFCVNERVVILLESEGTKFALVMVGATNVGSIRLSFSDLVTNKYFFKKKRSSKSPIRKKFSKTLIEKGERIGSFYLGSTVVMVFPKNFKVPALAQLPRELRYGESL